jgi:hypothetical protein
MRKAIVILCLISNLAIFSGCLTTIYPIFFEEDVRFNESLIGYWKGTNVLGKVVGFYEIRRIPETRKKELPAAIIKISDKGYLVSVIDSSGQEIGQNIVFLANIGRNLYLDFYPSETPLQKSINKHFKDHYIKVHTSYRYDVIGKDHFEVRQFDKGFLEKLIANNQINMPLSGNRLIESTTKDLQEYITRYGDEPKAFGGYTMYSRVIDY